ncbi:hypothetical protein [Paraburkholderia pallida]|uniref:Uncharacterized protein n=1 Tax=Paraburkholderia pallida TaxID=2547399 RepID=A0A4P7CTB5_9BURK|nr:hypothetical protein [Paraburkholderia pallida]QBQ99238.1 hypothetical protein E1956_18715 [Paraburkholderia pallida]
MLDIKALEEEAKKEVRDETQSRAKRAVVTKLKQIQTAEQVLVNLRREYDDLMASIADGSF